MKEPLLSSAHRVTDPRVAAVFSSPLRRRVLLLLAAQPRSLAELAKLASLDLKRLHYHVTTLQRLGLVVVTRQRARAGRAIKVYAAVAAAFMVAETAASGGIQDALAVELRSALDGVNHSCDGRLFYLGANGEPRMRRVGTAKTLHSDRAEYWRTLRLSTADFMLLKAAVEDCVAKFTRPAKSAARDYLLHFAIAPRTERS